MKKLWSVLLALAFVGAPVGAQTLAVQSIQASSLRLKRHTAISQTGNAAPNPPQTSPAEDGNADFSGSPRGMTPDAQAQRSQSSPFQSQRSQSSRFQSPRMQQPPSLGSQPQEPVDDSASVNPYVRDVVQLINRDRAQNGRPPVQECPRLSVIAQKYADFLLRTGYFGHVDPAGRTPEDRAQEGGFMSPVSENLAWEMSTFEDAPILLKRAEAGMMNEPRNERNHRYNILNADSRYVGVGVARSGTKVVMVQEFAADNE